MRYVLPLSALLLVACTTASASEEDYALWKSVTFTCQPMQPFPETTVTVESQAEAADRRIKLIRVVNKQFDLTVPKEAFADLACPMVDTVRLSSEAGYDKTPWMYVTFKLGNPKPGEAWDYPTAYIKIKDGKCVGRSLKRVQGNQTKYEELPFAPAAEPAFDAAKTAADQLAKIKPQLPEGWSVAADKNVVTISRQKPVEWYGTISLPAHKDKADLKAMGFVNSSPFTITVEFGSPLTPDDVAKLEEQNKRTMADYYRKHPVDPRAKPTSPPKEVTEKLHRIPNVLTNDFSALVMPSIQGSLAFNSPDDEAECKKVEQAVRKVLNPKAGQ